MNGLVSYSLDMTSPHNFGTIATFSCDVGFRLDGGDESRTCGGDGSSPSGMWSGMQAECIAYTCSSLPVISNGMIIYSPDGVSVFVFGAVANHSCNEGFYLSGNLIRMCTGSGMAGFWDGTEPECVAIMCTILVAPTNGLVSYGPDTTSPYNYQTTATYSCNEGYGLFGGDRSRQCMSSTPGDGGWSGTAPTCEVITCSTLSSPTNGRVDFSTSSPPTFGTMATYSCSEGYGLSGGNRMRICGGSGSSTVGVWNGTMPMCEAITCPDLMDPTNGLITFSPSSSAPYSFGTMASYSCARGFGLSGGDATRTCRGDDSSSNGEWSRMGPSCRVIMCSSLGRINNGAITYSPDFTSPFDFGTIASYSCNEGFFLTGESALTCDGDGSTVNGAWNTSAPVCSAVMCPTLPPPENGIITYSEDSSPTLGFMETATYSCNPGYGLSGGDTVRTCVGAAGSSGTWTGTAPSCLAITCPVLVAPMNGRVSYSTGLASSFSYRTIATYDCSSGFGLDGNRTRVCVGDGFSPNGVWSGATPECPAYICSLLPSISNGVITYSPDTASPFDYGSSAIYSCNTGYYLSGNSSRTCTGSGITGFWDGTEPECLEIMCTSLAATTNGLVSYGPDTTSPYDYQTTATYSCNEGYGLFGGDRFRQCLSSTPGDGGWNGTAPTCERITCPVLDLISNGVVDYSETPPYVYDTIALYTCNMSYGLSQGDMMRTCRGDGLSPNGEWSGNVPTCEAITCSNLVNPINGMIVFSASSSTLPHSFGTTASYSCARGFGLSGDATRTCGGDGFSTSGVWSGMDPICGAITCSQLNTINNGVISYTTDTTSPFDFGTNATYSCNEGFFLTGDDTQICGGDGSSVNGVWSGSAPVCAAVMCPTLPPPENGLITYSEDSSPTLGFMETATYSCNPGYGLSGGDTVRTCVGAAGSSGDWTGTAPNCQAITCSSIAAPENGQISFSVDTIPVYDFGTVATYSCNNGYGLNQGNMTRTCIGDGSSPNGVWSGTEPLCQGIICLALTSPMNGVVSFSQSAPYTFESTASYSCARGFGLSGGDTTRACGGDGSSQIGTWNGMEPRCEVITCSPLTSINNGIISYTPDTTSPFNFGTNATYSCNNEFFLTGEDTQTCSGDGSSVNGVWIGSAPVCAALFCPTLLSPENGIIMYSEESSPTLGVIVTATYSCNLGYGLLGGETVRTCVGAAGSSGNWIGTPPTCLAITCSSLVEPVSGQVSYFADTISPFNFGTVATYNCDDGYSISQTDVSQTCGGDGSSPNGEWIGSIPTCEAITCPDLIPSPVNGMITYSTSSSAPYMFGTIASYSCARGFGLSGGDATRTCGGDGSSLSGEWSGMVASCEAITCMPLNSINNGVTSYATDTTSPFDFGTTATYSCNDGFFLTGDDTQTCSGDGSSVNGVWSGTVPICAAVMCPTLPAPENGLITYSEDSSPTLGFIQTAIYSCNPGYGLSGGDTVRTCVGEAGSTGNWTGSAPSCQAITCVSLGAPANGQISYSPDTTAPFDFGTVATINCGTGFGLAGDMTRTCQGDGSGPTGVWSGASFSCLAYTCPLLPSFPNGMVIYSPDATSPFDFGTIATYSCTDGFYLSENTTRTCSGSGTFGYWDGREPECLAIVCTSLAAPTNGLISYGPDSTSPYNYQTTATYSCSEGYGLFGGDRSRQCVSSTPGDGGWSGTAPTCGTIFCLKPSPLANVQVVFSTDPPYMYGTIAIYTCNEGYIKSGGNLVQSCGGDGTTTEGEWSGTIPTCIPITCPDLINPNNGSITFSPSSSAPHLFGTMASYSCVSGLGLTRGDTTRICGGDGSSPNGEWNGTAPSCEAITCLPLNLIANGSIEYSSRNQLSQYVFGTKANFLCQTGFYLIGDTERTCSGDGSSVDGVWSGSGSVCSAISCPKLPDPDSGFISYSKNTSSTSLGFMDTATYGCKDGFGLSSVDKVRTCIGSPGSSGEWNGTAPSCLDLQGDIGDTVTIGASAGAVVVAVLVLIIAIMAAALIISRRKKGNFVITNQGQIQTDMNYDNPLYDVFNPNIASDFENPTYMDVEKKGFSDSGEDPAYMDIDSVKRDLALSDNSDYADMSSKY